MVSRRCMLQAATVVAGALVGERVTGVLKSAAFAADVSAPPDSSPLRLWYRQPASKFEEALPLGNGRLGAMVYGGVEKERLSLNEDTLYAGSPYDPVNPEALAALPEVRRLIFAGEYLQAQDLIQAKMMSKPIKQMQYQPIGDLLLSFPSHGAVSNYRRLLDIDRAISEVSYDLAGVRYTRECFITPLEQVIVLRLGASEAGRLDFDVSLKTPLPDGKQQVHAESVILTGRGRDAQGIPGKLTFEARARVLTTGGKLQSHGEMLQVRGADAATLLISIGTTYKRYNDLSNDPSKFNLATLEAAEKKSVEELKSTHIAEHQQLFDRVAIDLGTSDAAKLPTDERVAQSATLDDPALAALYYQYGRYLLIGSSRPGSQPANLQGIWNENPSPPWGSKYTININTEMNYWPSETTNLAELGEPLFKMIEEIAETGAITAKKMYNASGWVTHHNTDLWRATGPIDAAFYGMWPTGGAWLCKHLWEHYLFGLDEKFLQRAYPILKGASQFFLDVLVEDPKTKHLVTCPSISPENAHHPKVSICAGPMMDSQIIRDLFNHTIDAAKVLNKDSEFAARLRQTCDRLPPNKIGKHGQLQEWMEDWDDQAGDQKHRHISHLYGLFPSNQIDVIKSPELAAAAKVTLNTRGDVTTGWAIAWRLNCWARLHDGERAHKILRLLLDPSRTYPNLFDAHPPFQIDGNFGGTSGMTELLLQSHNNELHLLPALPKAWPTGSISGLRARGGVEVSLKWKEGILETCTLKSLRDGSFSLRYGDRVMAVDLQANVPQMVDANLKRS